MAFVWAVPLLFLALQVVRVRRALHVFQLEGYKRKRFVAWARQNPRRALFLSPWPGKKPLVMTERARRIYACALASSTAITVIPLLLVSLLGASTTVAWAAAVIAAVAVFFATSEVVVAGDLIVDPVQKRVNAGFLAQATARLAQVKPTVVGVTGSFGKTSTKFAIQRLLGSDVALATPGSFNTPLGVCRTINEQLESHHEFFVVEMGAYGVGEIAELCDFVHPTIGVLTAIGPAHLERFGSLDAIRRAKYELVESLPADGLAVMNVDDPEVRSLADGTTHVQVFRYGLEPSAYPDVTARDVAVTGDGTSMTIEFRQADITLAVTTRLLGRHAIGHILAAVSVAKFAGMQMAELKQAIESMEPVEHRLQLIKGEGGVTVIDDAYNSNPEGAAAALDVLAAIPGRKKVIVTPGIIELGPLQFEENERLGEHAARIADCVIAVAPTNRAALAAGVERAGASGKLIVVDSLEAATAELAGIIGPGDVVLFENDLPDHFEA